MHRKLAVIVGCLIAAGVSACGATEAPTGPAAPVSSSATAHDAPHHGTPLDPDPATGINADLAAVRQATAAFHDAAKAAAAGYLFNEPCQESPAGAMGIHAPNPALVRDGVIDPLRPEVLLYLPREDGTLRLVGVEYMQIATVRNPATGIAAPWRSPSPWPQNFELITPTPALFGETFQGPMPGHSATMPWHWDLHAWIWAHNPDGLFAQWNPKLHCP